jgi:hypothetical protein
MWARRTQHYIVISVTCLFLLLFNHTALNCKDGFEDEQANLEVSQPKTKGIPR